MEASSALGGRVTRQGHSPVGQRVQKGDWTNVEMRMRPLTEGDRKRKGRRQVSFERLIQTVGSGQEMSLLT